MNRLTTIFREILGLFVDDNSFALAILLWLAAARWLLPRLPLPPHVPGILLFAGLTFILGESALRYSKRPSNK